MTLMHVLHLLLALCGGMPSTRVSCEAFLAITARLLMHFGMLAFALFSHLWHARAVHYHVIGLPPRCGYCTLTGLPVVSTDSRNFERLGAVAKYLWGVQDCIPLAPAALSCILFVRPL